MEQRQDRAVGMVSNRAAKRRLRWLRNGAAPRDGSSISRAVDICSAGIRDGTPRRHSQRDPLAGDELRPDLLNRADSGRGLCVGTHL